MRLPLSPFLFLSFSLFLSHCAPLSLQNEKTFEESDGVANCAEGTEREKERERENEAEIEELITLAAYARITGHAEEGLSLLRSALSLSPNSPSLWLSFAKALRENERESILRGEKSESEGEKAISAYLNALRFCERNTPTPPLKCDDISKEILGYIHSLPSAPVRSKVSRFLLYPDDPESIEWAISSSESNWNNEPTERRMTLANYGMSTLHLLFETPIVRTSVSSYPSDSDAWSHATMTLSKLCISCGDPSLSPPPSHCTPLLDQICFGSPSPSSPPPSPPTTFPSLSPPTSPLPLISISSLSSLDDVVRTEWPHIDARAHRTEVVSISENSTFISDCQANIGGHVTFLWYLGPGTSESVTLNLIDPRMGAGSLPFEGWKTGGGWDGGVPLRLNMEIGDAIAFPSDMKYYILSDSLPRVFIRRTYEVKREIDRDSEGSSPSLSPSPPTSHTLSHYFPLPLLRTSRIIDPADLPRIYHIFKDLAEGNPQNYRHKSNRGGIQTSTDILSDDNFKKYPLLRQLKMLFYQAVTSYLLRNEEVISQRSNSKFGGRHSGTIQLRIESAWIGLNSKGSLNVPHTHPGSHISGVFYVSTGGLDPNGETQITFLAPFVGDYSVATSNYSVSWFISPSPSPSFSSSNIFQTNGGVTLRVIPGDLLVFPSWADHFVPIHQGEALRVVIAYNCHVQWDRDTNGPIQVFVEM